MRAASIPLLASLVLAMSPTGAQALDFLYIPPIAGADSMPGYPGVIPLFSFSWAGHQLTLDKAVDATTPEFFAAALAGTHFATADVLFYEGATSTLDLIFEMTDVVVSSDRVVDGDSPFEHVGLDFATSRYVVPSSSPVPEPSTSALTLVGLLAVAALALKRRWGAGVLARRAVDGLRASTGWAPEVR